jgi:hypothetical protein
MKHHFKLFSPTWAALAASALIAACGGGGSTSAPSGSEDKTPPTVTITDSVASGNATGVITFTFDFDEVVGGFTEADINVTGGQKGTFSMAINNRSATLQVTPTANSTGTVQVSVAAGSFMDVADNVNTAAVSASQTFDTTTPPPVTTSTTIATFDETSASTLDAFGGTTFEAFTEGSNKVAKLNKLRTSQPWGGATLLTCPAGTVGFTPAIPFTADHKSISVMVKAPRAGVVFTLKAEGMGSNAGSAVFAQTSNTGTGWEKLTFNFANKTAGTDLDITKAYNKVSIFPNWTEVSTDTANQVAETEDRVYLFDDFKFEGVNVTLPACPPQQSPTAAASNPSGTPVVTVYSDANGYTPISGITWTWQPSWNNATPQSEQTIGSGSSLKYTNFGFSVIEGSSTINVSTANFVNLDVWTPDVTTFRLKLVDYGANGVYGTDDSEYEVSEDLTNNLRQWKRIRIPLSSFTDLAAKTRIGQIILSSPTPGGTVFVDNIHFSSN